MTQFLRTLLGVILLAATVTPAAADADKLQISQFVQTFSEEFDTLNVTARGPAKPWIAHTPWNGDFGEAQFTDPSPDFPFMIRNGHLRIVMRKDAAGKWRSGLLASWDDKGNGFAQRYGYFEMRARLPRGPGVWPAFWLIGTDRKVASPEIDVLEHYGSMPDRFYAHVHTWDKVNPSKSTSEKGRIEVPDGSLSTSFNTYGVLITSTLTTIYFNRRKVWQTATLPAHRQPMFILVNLAAGGGFPIDAMQGPRYLVVDYIRAYRQGP